MNREFAGVKKDGMLIWIRCLSVEAVEPRAYECSKILLKSGHAVFSDESADSVLAKVTDCNR